MTEEENKLDLLIWKLTELASVDIGDIESDEFEILGEDAEGRDAYCTVSITRTAKDALETIKTMITKEKSGEIFDRCVDAVDRVDRCYDTCHEVIFKSDAIEAIEQERNRYE
jgi:hypothetical protein